MTNPGASPYTVVRTEVEYVTLVLYSFFAPLLIIFVMINMILGTAVKVDPRLIPGDRTRFQRLMLKYDEPLSSFHA
jgi:hypothetical protein